MDNEILGITGLNLNKKKIRKGIAAMKSGFVQSGSARINFEYYEHIEGERETLVFLHGNGESLESFEKQKDFFTKDYSVLLIDSRGHGQSDFGAQGLNLNLMAEDIYCVINHLRIPKASIIGFSDGANLAMIFAYTHPDRLNRLVLTGGSIRPFGCKLSFQLPIIISYILCSIAAKLDSKNDIHRDILGIMVKEPKIKESDLNKIKAKTLVMVGSKDMIRLSHTKRIVNAIKDSRLEIVPGADHFIPYKMPEKFNDTVLKFIKE